MKYLIEMKFPSGVHFGSDVAGYGVEEVQGIAHSDTIFSALINTLVSAKWHFSDYQWINNFLDQEQGNPEATLPFKISSFGFVDTSRLGDHKYYLPRPQLIPRNVKKDAKKSSIVKKFKKIKFINIIAFYKWQQGEELDLEEIIQESEYLKPFWIEEPKTQHITDSITLETQIFRTGLVFYRQGVKPFVIVDLDEDKFPFQEFWKLLNLQKINGLGGRRSTGCGAFEISGSDWFCIDAEMDKQEQINPDFNPEKRAALGIFKKLFEFSSDYQYLFSLFFPRDIDNVEMISYQLIQRKGWFYSNSSFYQLKRKTCVMLGEGSIIKKNSSELEGKVVDVTPGGFNEHKIYRYGIPFTIPFVR